jgi:hypothetical protein
MDPAFGDPLACFLGSLLREGRALVTTKREPLCSDFQAALAILEEAFQTYRLRVGGALIAFDAAIALRAAMVTHAACLALVDRSARPEELARDLDLGPPPKTAAQHLSADLCLRFVAQIHRRAKAIDPADPFVAMLENSLHAWPLSGAMAELDDPPNPAPHFADHPGLISLYCERLVPAERVNWYPQGTHGEHVELVRAATAKDRR